MAAVVGDVKGTRVHGGVKKHPCTSLTRIQDLLRALKGDVQWPGMMQEGAGCSGGLWKPCSGSECASPKPQGTPSAPSPPVPGSGVLCPVGREPSCCFKHLPAGDTPV